tara:strand:+ start:61 stop:594 length:534 start_codon:yes stop_codon:yes gene_type:complete
MNDIKIEDNFLLENEFQSLSNNFTNPLFPWYINQIINDDYEQGSLLVDPKDNYQFVHHFYYPVSGCPPKICSGIDCLNPIFKRLDFTSLARIKANCLPRASSIRRHGFHVDHPNTFSKELKVSIFYINTNNGYTEFEDGTKIESIANRLVTFPIHLRHTGTTCTDQSVRIVINFNYF